MIRDGFDCILRAGDLADSALIAKRIATLERGTFASPGYLARFGTPRTPDDLEGHRMVGLLTPDTNEIAPLVFCTNGKPRRMILPAAITVTGPETNVAAACQGLGLIQTPRYRTKGEVERGQLAEVLADHPPTPLPVHILYAPTRHLTPRLRVFIDWVAARFGAEGQG
jgi:DNA-binding transcriptional LysR family regulator